MKGIRGAIFAIKLFWMLIRLQARAKACRYTSFRYDVVMGKNKIAGENRFLQKQDGWNIDFPSGVYLKYYLSGESRETQGNLIHLSVYLKQTN